MEIKLDRKKDYITKSDHKEQIMNIYHGKSNLLPSTMKSVK